LYGKYRVSNFNILLSLKEAEDSDLWMLMPFTLISLQKERNIRFLKLVELPKNKHLLLWWSVVVYPWTSVPIEPTIFLLLLVYVCLCHSDVLWGRYEKNVFMLVVALSSLYTRGFVSLWHRGAAKITLPVHQVTARTGSTEKIYETWTRNMCCGNIVFGDTWKRLV